ncbi:MAG: hypothetical protein AB1486_03490 [Planctomycetota bacterium]
MRRSVLAVATLGLLALPVMAQENVPPQFLNITRTDGWLESSWVVQVPSGNSDYFNTRYDSVPVYPPITELAIAGVSVGSAAFWWDTSYPLVGLFDANLTLDPSGNTPDLNSGISAGPVIGGCNWGAFNYVFGSFGGNVVPASEPQHVVCQLPPDDPGMLRIGGVARAPSESVSGWTMDGYRTPANSWDVDFGLNVVADAISELQGLPGGCNSYLHFYLSRTDESGDFRRVEMCAAEVFLGVVYHTSCSGALWQLWESFLGVPVRRLSQTLFTLPSGGGGYLRAGDFWPAGFGGLTLNFAAIGGVPGVQGSVHVSNEVTLQTLPDAPGNWGVRDDGTIETGWVVSAPSQTSDYFSNWFNCMVMPPITTVTDFKLAVMDFGTTATAFPTSGVFTANTTLDPSGWTPDLSNGFAVAPFTFVPMTFSTTSGRYVTRDFADFPYSTFGTDDVHGVIQFPPGDTGLVAVGGDVTPKPTIRWASTWTSDGYRTRARRCDTEVGWGLRLGSF